MKFAKRLADEVDEHFAGRYVDYEGLKRLLKRLAAVGLGNGAGGRVRAPPPVSLTSDATRAARPAASGADEDAFHAAVDAEERRVRDTVAGTLAALEARFGAARDAAGRLASGDSTTKAALLAECRAISDAFVALEKYTNLNLVALYKILKKHDKKMPGTPYAAYRLQRIQREPWLKTDHSAVFVVGLSELHARLRGDETGATGAPTPPDAQQIFVRTTRKFWVKQGDVSAVKHAILQQLPVFLPPEAGDDVCGDSQLVNSVYFDNVPSLELYHARLSKLPHSQALRLRYYGSAGCSPRKVFVERKTHLSSWTGDTSRKERFALPEGLVVPFLTGEHTADAEVARLLGAGEVLGEDQARSLSDLMREVHSLVEAKLLQPTVRTSYERSAFQLPNDATVRISIDVNLCMLSEGGPTCDDILRGRGAWRREPELENISRAEVARFPHAVLEVKTCLGEGELLPEWVDELIGSGLLTEVHKFSKFLHGTAVLYPGEVREVPYWCDDLSLADSINEVAVEAPREPGQGSELTHPLLQYAADPRPIDLLGDTERRTRRNRGEAGGLFGRLFGSGAGGLGSGVLERLFGRPCRGGPVPKARKVPMRIEPKVYFANERTFLSWLSMSVNIGIVAAALGGLAIGGKSAAGGGDGASEPVAFNRDLAIIAITMLPTSIAFAAYALATFMWRGRRIHARDDVAFHDPVGPVVLGVFVMMMLTVILGLSIARCAQHWHDE